MLCVCVDLPSCQICPFSCLLSGSSLCCQVWQQQFDYLAALHFISIVTTMRSKRVPTPLSLSRCQRAQIAGSAKSAIIRLMETTIRTVRVLALCWLRRQLDHNWKRQNKICFWLGWRPATVFVSRPQRPSRICRRYPIESHIGPI